MSLVPAQIEANEARRARLARMGGGAPRVPIVTAIAREPGQEPEPIREVKPDPAALKFREWLNLASPEAARRPSWRNIMEVVVARTGVSHVNLVGVRRQTPVVEARQIACYLMRDITAMSYPQIGARLGGRDHTTVLHACAKIQARIDRDPVFSALIDVIKSEIAVRASQ